MDVNFSFVSPQEVEPQRWNCPTLLSAVLLHSHDGITLQDFDGRILAWNRGAELMYGYTETEALHGDVVGVMHEAMAQQGSLWMEGIRRGTAVVPFEISRISKDGRRVAVMVNVSPILDRSGVVRTVLTTERDVTVRQAILSLEEARSNLEQQHSERTAELTQTNCDLMGENELLQVTLACMGDALITTDTHGNITFLNPAAEKLTGWTNAEALALPISKVYKIISEATRQVTDDPVKRCLRDREVKLLKEDTLLIRRFGQELSIDDTAAPVFNTAREMIGAVLLFRDITENRRMVQQLTQQALHDPLTGLINRREFERRLTLLSTLPARSGPHHLLYLDLDQFKVVNDTCGHVVGDALLRQISAVLRSKLSEPSSLGRLGGDEFGILLECSSPEQARHIANELRQAVQEFSFSWEERQFTIGVSIGVVSIESGQSCSSLLSAADSACYVAKERGRNKVHVYGSDNATAERHKEMQWVRRIQDALREDHFRLYHQPIVPIKPGSSQQNRGEILIRLVDPQGNVILPDEFLSAAEHYGQMAAIDRWVVSHSLRALHNRKRAVPTLSYSVNVSGQSLGEEQFLEFVINELQRAQVPPSSICFEITETAAIANLNHAIRFISSLREIGCEFALDDFGMGLSSFSYLRTLPVDYIKIAGPFVSRMMLDPFENAIVEAIHRIGHMKGIKTIAEWVQDDASLARLLAIGVDYVQGNYVAFASPLQEQTLGAHS